MTSVVKSSQCRPVACRLPVIGNIKHALRSDSGAWFCVFAILAAFCTYSCMYAFRKPIAAGVFEDLHYLGISLKIWYLSAQVTGYALSKFIGLKVISEQNGSHRGALTLLLIGIAGFALLLFAVVPHPWNIACMFLNGVPLGMVWGLVFSYLEGRKVTEILVTGLCASFIIASGVVKTIGSYLMLYWGVSEFWMPVTTAMLFVPPLIVSVYMLEHLPPPNQQDIAFRTRRKPMKHADRVALFKQFSTGLTLLIIGHIVLAVFRDLRDSFSVNIWHELGFADSPEIFTLTEVPIAILVLLIVGSTVFIKNNYRAFAVNHCLILCGFILCALPALLYQKGLIDPVLWMMASGFGLYLAYVTFGSVLFERFIATFQIMGNVGFLIYLSDSFGYLASVLFMVYKILGKPDLQWHTFIIQASYLVAAVGIVSTLWSWRYFAIKQGERAR